MELLLFSNSTLHGRGYLEHATEVLHDYLQGVESLVFVPFALADHQGYTAKVDGALARYGARVTGLHTAEDPVGLLRQADAIFVGGGNTFRLAKSLQERRLLEPLRDAVLTGTRYLGASAGTNIAAPSLRTTNDMPIVQPPSFETLGLLPFQINAHYLDADPASTHAGETREDRISEFLEENDVPVLGLREGTHLRVSQPLSPRAAGEVQADSQSGLPAGGALTAYIGGTAASPDAPGPAVLHRRHQAAVEVSGDVTCLWQLPARFDVRDR